MKTFVTSLSIFSVAIAAVAGRAPELYFDNDLYATWLKTNGTGYETSVFLNTSDDTSGVGVFWTIDRTDQKIELAVVCPTSSGVGWCAFGIAEAGAMLGSDMVIFESQTNSLYDAHVLDDINAGPVRDSCQNWQLLNSASSGDDSGDGFLLFEAQRSLDTGDTFDRALIDDSDSIVPPTRVISAWLDAPTVSYHGKNVARSSIRFFRNDEADDDVAFHRSMEELAEGSFELRANNYPVPEEETYYAAFCFTYADLVAMGVPENADLHVIGIEPVVDDDAKEFVHHFVVDGSMDPFENYTSPIAEDVCRDLPIMETAYVWAPGEGPFAFPDNIGGPLGSNGYKTYNLEIHYNNPSLKTGVLDSSGIRVHWTTKKREHDMGILQLGDPFLTLAPDLVGNGLTHHTFDCPASCSQASLPESGVTVIREYLHMHKSGARMYNEQIRDGKVVHTGALDFWDFDQQGNAPVQQASFQILRGDSFRTRCYYQSDDETWGLGSQEEMCMSFIFYYPRQVLDVGGDAPFPYTCARGLDFFAECNSTYANVSVDSTRELERSFGGSGGTCETQSDEPNKDKTNDQTSAAFTSYSVLATVFAVSAMILHSMQW